MSNFWRFQPPKTHIFTKKLLLVGSVQGGRNFYMNKKFWIRNVIKNLQKKILGQSDFNFKRYSMFCHPPKFAELRGVAA